MALIAISIAITSVSGQRKNNRDSKDSQSEREGKKKREAEFYFTEGEKFFILENYAKSLAYFQKALGADSKNSAAHYKISQIELENEQFNQALKSIEKAIELQPENKFYYLQKVDIYTEQGDLIRAAETYETMLTAIPDSRPYLFELAMVYLYLSDYESALSAYVRLEEFYGYDADIALQKHQLYSRMEETEKATEELEKLHLTFPANAEYLNTLAKYLLQNGETKKSLSYLKSYLNTEGDNSEIKLLIGEILRKEGEIQEAEKYLVEAFSDASLDVSQKIRLIAEYRSIGDQQNIGPMVLKLGEILIKVHPDVANAYSVLGDYLQYIGQAEGAVQLYEKAAALDPSNFTVWQNMMLIYSSIGKYKDVIRVADQTLQYFPNQSIVYYLYGFAANRQSEFEQAIQMLKIGKQLAGNNMDIVNDFNGLLGEAYNGAGKYKESNQAFEEVLTSDPLNYNVLNNYSYYLSIRGEDLKKADEMSEKLIKDNPSVSTFLDTRAWVLYKQKRYREARKVIQKAIEIEERATYFDHQGDILFQLGKTDEAVASWKKAKLLDGGINQIDKKIEERKIYEN